MDTLALRLAKASPAEIEGGLAQELMELGYDELKTQFDEIAGGYGFRIALQCGYTLRTAALLDAIFAKWEQLFREHGDSAAAEICSGFRDRWL